jgi:dTDP-4-amino-4,6-dideoxygalactose transaminase
MRRMRESGVETSIHYPPVHRLTSFATEAPCLLPRTESLATRELTLPLFPTMTTAQQDLVCESLGQALDQAHHDRTAEHSDLVGSNVGMEEPWSQD